jgi:hypothetical protein
MESSSWRKLKMRVENKRHTNAHRPLISPSPTGVSIPPLSARFPPTASSGKDLRAPSFPVFAPNFDDSNCNWGTVREQFDSSLFIASSASRVTQNLLDDFVGNAEPMKIRSQSASKRVQAVPRNLLRFECGPNHFTRQQIEIQRVPP